MKVTIAFLDVLILIVYVRTRQITVLECDKNEYYSTCGTNCEPRCNSTSPRYCGSICVEGCFCKNGYIREKRGGPCILLEECKENKPPFCGPNEKYSNCTSTCVNTCLSDKIWSTCSHKCVEGCICREGFIKVVTGGACIPKNSCSKACTDDRIFNPCGPASPVTCQNPNPVFNATCTKGCFCQVNLVEDSVTGLCVLPANYPGNILSIFSKDKINNVDKSGVYKIACIDESCPVAYIGETSRKLKIRIAEHEKAYKNLNAEISKYPKHLIENHNNIKMNDIRFLNYTKLLHTNIIYRKQLETLEIHKLLYKNHPLANEQILKQKMCDVF